MNQRLSEDIYGILMYSIVNREFTVLLFLISIQYDTIASSIFVCKL